MAQPSNEGKIKIHDTMIHENLEQKKFLDYVENSK